MTTFIKRMSIKEGNHPITFILLKEAGAVSIKSFERKCETLLKGTATQCRECTNHLTKVNSPIVVTIHENEKCVVPLLASCFFRTKQGIENVIELTPSHAPSVRPTNVSARG
jgi:hypothetical protein